MGSYTLGMCFVWKDSAATFGHRTSIGTTESGACFCKFSVASYGKSALSDFEKINTQGLAHAGLQHAHDLIITQNRMGISFQRARSKIRKICVV